MESKDLPEADLDLIEEGLYLGSVTAAVETQTLQRHRISHILTVESQPLPSSITSLRGMKFMYIEIDDMPHEDLLSHFEKTNEFIEDGQKKGNVLVHCYFGMSRSATLVTSFLMNKHRISVDEALQRVKSKRRYVGPNSGFLAQLVLYQTMGQSLVTSNGQYKLYRLQAVAKSVMKSADASMDLKYQSVVQPDPRSGCVCGPVAYKCRQCRSSLISVDSIVPHCPGESPAWGDAKWSRRLDQLQVCDGGIFTFPISWMGDTMRSLEGKLLCPKCQAKIGSYSWREGCCCSCEAKVAPAFYFIPSKLDKCIMDKTFPVP